MTNEDWQRLADYVISRRAELGIKDRRVFMGLTGVTDRTLGKIEHGERVSRTTLAHIEPHLQWEPGSARRILEGGEPVIKGQEAPRREFSDPQDQRLWEQLADVDLDDDIKRGMIAMARDRRDRERNDGHRRAV